MMMTMTMTNQYTNSIPCFTLFAITYIDIGSIPPGLRSLIKKFYTLSPHTYFIKYYRASEEITTTMLTVDIFKCTVYDVKKMINERFYIPVHRQMLCHRSGVLSNFKRIVDYKPFILHGETLHVTLDGYDIDAFVQC